MIRFFENKLYRLALLIVARFLIKHDKKYGGKHVNDINGLTFIPIDKKGYFFKYRLYLGKDSKIHYGISDLEEIIKHNSTNDCL